jgi:cytochrome b
MAAIPRKKDGNQPAVRCNGTVKVWDPLVRVVHWTVVTACMLNLFVLEEGKYWHRMTGYIVVASLVIRFLWGFVGTRHARFSDFFPTPASVKSQIVSIVKGSEERFLGHNPLASVMMLTLMTLLAATCLTGWMSTLDAFWGQKWLEELHGAIANSIMVLAGIHAVAALIESWRHRENLVWAMVTGRKRA